MQALIYFLLGLAGIILHILIKIRQSANIPNSFKTFRAYLFSEWVNISISIIVVAIAVYCKAEIIQSFPEYATKYIDLVFVVFGYFGDSILSAFLGKAQTILNLKNKDNESSK